MPKWGAGVYHLAQETSDDWWEVEALYDLCFAPGREALSSYRLRDDVAAIAQLCLVARDNDRTLAAAIRYWPVRIGDRDALLLGPVAVHPTRQGEGLGGFLIRESLAIALALNWHRVLLIGDAPYYRRFGFEKVDDVIMPPPTNPDRILGHSLTENAWKDVQGTVLKYSPD
jgi:predicted N-acetyltransferase YhbS